MNLPKKTLAMFRSQKKNLAAQMVGRSSCSPSWIKTKKISEEILQKPENTHLKNFTEY
jgi:hypothetical protein